MVSDNELWLPPLAPKDQQRIEQQRKRQQKQYYFAWTGFRGKTVWDWLQLLAFLAIPLAVALRTAWFSASQNQTSLLILQDQQQETTLQTYLDRMSELLLNNHLSTSSLDDDVRQVAQAQTLVVLPQLNGARKREVVSFLYDTGLIIYKEPPGNTGANSIIDLQGADLRNADLRDVDLSRANLGGANLERADLHNTSLEATYLDATDLKGADLDQALMSVIYLSSADLRDTNLSDAYLFQADLSDSNLNGANLKNANLSSAFLYYAVGLTNEQLSQAKSLKGATMPDGSKHP